MNHQNKSKYTLGPSQTTKVDFFAENFFCKRLQLRCLTSFIRRFQKHFSCFVRGDFASWKNDVISTPVCLTLLFKKNMWL